MIFQMVAGDSLGFHPLPGLGVKQQGVQLLHMGTGLHQLGSSDVGAGLGGREPEAAGIRGQAGIQAIGNVGGDLHMHGTDHLIQQFCRSGGAAVQQRELGVAAVSCMVVDAQVHMARVLGNAVALAKQLDAGNIHSHHDLRLKFALEQAGVGKCVPAGDGVGAEHGCVFFQCKQRIVERAAAADRITIRVFVAQNQDVIRSKQLFCHLLYIQLFCHPMFHPFRKADYSSVSSGWLVSSASPFTFSVRSSSLMWAA